MILLFSVLITDDGFSIYDRGRLPSSRRTDIFKYTLASLATIDWSNAYFFFQLEGSYAGEEESLKQFIEENYPRAEIHYKRLIELEQWRQEIDRITAANPNELLWYSNNDDHVFFDRSLDCLNACTAHMQELQRAGRPMVALFPSHWADMVADRRQMLFHSRDFSINTRWTYDGIQIITPELMRRWFFDESAHLPPQSRVRRSEDLGYNKHRPFMNIIPHRELMRHFDGNSFNGHAAAESPPLAIPPGFFERNIKIATYRFDARTYRELSADGYTIVDPTCKTYNTTDPDGATLRVTLDDIPLFWRDRISEIRKPSDYSADRLAGFADQATHDLLRQTLPLDIATARRLIPAAFRIPAAPPAAAAPFAVPAAPAPSAHLDRADRQAFRKKSVLANPNATLIIIDKTQNLVSGPNQDIERFNALTTLVDTEIRPLKALYGIEFCYLLIDQRTAHWTINRICHSALDKLVDTVYCHFYEDYHDRLLALEHALTDCHGSLVIVLEWLFSCGGFGIGAAVRGVLEGHQCQLMSEEVMIGIPSLFTQSARPEQAFIGSMLAGSAHRAAVLREVLARRRGGFPLDILSNAEQLGELYHERGLEVRMMEPSNGAVFRDARLVPHDKLFVNRDGLALGV